MMNPDAPVSDYKHKHPCYPRDTLTVFGFTRKFGKFEEEKPPVNLFLRTVLILLSENQP